MRRDVGQPSAAGNAAGGVGINRRIFFSALGAGTMLALAGCAAEQNQSTDNIGALPNGFLPNQGLVSSGPEDTGYAPPANFKMKVYHAPAAGPVAPRGVLGIIPRSAWALAGPNMRTIQPMDGVRLITFHHTGDPKPFYDDSFAGTARYWELIREYQRRVGFEDIAYHFGIDRVGRVWQLRPLQYRGEHVRDGFAPPRWLDEYVQRANCPTRPVHGRYVWNAHNIGVVSLGNFMLQRPTAAQKSKIVTIGRLLRRLYGIPIYHCYTHQELVATLCPGSHLQPYMESIRRDAIL